MERRRRIIKLGKFTALQNKSENVVKINYSSAAASLSHNILYQLPDVGTPYIELHTFIVS